MELGGNQKLFWERRLRVLSAWGIANSFQQTIHWMVCLHCLLTFFGGTLCVPFGLWGLLARNAGRPLLSLRDISPTLWGNLPTPRRKLLKKLEQNFYVLLAFGAVVNLGGPCSPTAH